MADSDQSRRNIYQFSVRRKAFTGREFHYRAEVQAILVADMAAIGRHRIVVIERDAGSGANALFRGVYRIDLRRGFFNGCLLKTTRDT